MKPLILNFAEDVDEYYYCRQKVWSENEDEKIQFFVQDLCECPEDAIIGRDLFSGHDFIEALRLGMKLAQEGYDSIEIEEVPW